MAEPAEPTMSLEPTAFEPSSSEPVISTTSLAAATRWLVAGRIVTQASRLVVSVVLARLLTPEAFGVVAVAMTTIVALEVVKDLGTGAAVIQRPSVDQRLLSSVFYLNIVAGFVAAGLMVVGAPLIAEFFDVPASAPVVRAFALVLAIGGLTQVHHALLRRAMRFNVVASIEMTGALTNGVVSIALALGGLGVWSMVWGNVAGVALGSVVAWVRSGWTPSRMFGFGPLREIAGFSAHTAGYNVTTFLLQNTDKLLVGRWLGTAPLGVYSLAQRTISYPLESISRVLMTILFPAFARAQDDNELLRKGYTRAAGAVAFVTLPVMVGAAVVAQPLVETVLHEAWQPLVPLLWFMAPAGALGALLSCVNTLYSAKGRADQMFRWGVASGVFTLAAFAVGLQWDLQGLAVAYLVAMVIQVPVGYAFVLRLIDMPLRHMARALAPYFAMTALMAVAVALAVVGLDRAGAGALWQLVAGIGVGVGVYGGLAVWWRPPAVHDVVTVIRHRD
jgi:PST family polysaccharide transporter